MGDEFTQNCPPFTANMAPLHNPGGTVDYDVKDLGLAKHGSLRIEWAETSMPVLRLVRKRFAKDRPLRGIRLAACLHVTSETANLMQTLQAAGRGRAPLPFPPPLSLAARAALPPPD